MVWLVALVVGLAAMRFRDGIAVGVERAVRAADPRASVFVVRMAGISLIASAAATLLVTVHYVAR